MVWHAPLYIPLKVFKQMEAILNSFVWGNGRHKLARHVLKNPTDRGGVSFPDLQDYYLAAQLSHIYHFNKEEMQRYRSLVCNKPGHPAFTPIQAILRGKQITKKLPRYNMGMLLHHQRIWEITLKKQNIGKIHTHTPLWFNKHLPELEYLSDSIVWATYGIINIHQVLSDARLKQFQVLKEEYTLPNQMAFKYLQLRHALKTQIPNMEVVSDSPPVLDVILGEEPSKLILTLYLQIRNSRSNATAQKAKMEWEKDIGPIGEEDWDEIMEGTRLTSPKLSDRLTEIYIIHKGYLTPLKKAKFLRTYDPSCHLCHAAPGTFFHLIWSCPNIQTYWTLYMTIWDPWWYWTPNYVFWDFCQM